jgi:hypothetical protein
MGWLCSTHGDNFKHIWERKIEREGRTILKWILREWNVTMWNEFIWLASPCEHGNESSGSMKGARSLNELSDCQLLETVLLVVASQRSASGGRSSFISHRTPTSCLWNVVQLFACRLGCLLVLCGCERSGERKTGDREPSRLNKRAENRTVLCFTTFLSFVFMFPQHFLIYFLHSHVGIGLFSLLCRRFRDNSALYLKQKPLGVITVPRRRLQYVCGLKALFPALNKRNFLRLDSWFIIHNM